MSLDHFGASFDIHGGGHDLRFPHHVAEIFQSECHRPCPLELLVAQRLRQHRRRKDEQVAWKLLTIRDIVQKDPFVLRLALVNAHYRSPIDMNEQLLKDAQRNHSRILQVYESALRLAVDAVNVLCLHLTQQAATPWRGVLVCSNDSLKVLLKPWMTISTVEMLLRKCLQRRNNCNTS